MSGMGKRLFIVLDGMDGSGKSLMIDKLKEYLSSKNKDYRILITKEPTDSRFGKEARKMLQTEKDPMANAKKSLELYVKDRKEHLDSTILPFLGKEGSTNIVICDRYYYSTIAFQHTQGLGWEEVLNANNKFEKPDIAFILDLPPETALERITRAREGKEKFEKLGFMKKLRANFLELPKRLKDNIKIIDASKDKDAVFGQIKREMDGLLIF